MLMRLLDILFIVAVALLVTAFVFVVSSCRSPGLVETRLAKSQEGYSSVAGQKCEQAKAAVEIANIAIPAFVRALESHRMLIGSAENALRGQRWVCLIRNPESCGGRGPCISKYRCRRMIGCASAGYAWASICRPAECLPDWPNEPGCTTGERSHKGWRELLVWELGNSVVARSAKWDRRMATKNYYDAAPMKLIHSAKIKKAIIDMVKKTVNDLPDGYCDR